MSGVWPTRPSVTRKCADPVATGVIQRRVGAPWRKGEEDEDDVGPAAGHQEQVEELLEGLGKKMDGIMEVLRVGLEKILYIKRKPYVTLINSGKYNKERVVHYAY